MRLIDADAMIDRLKEWDTKDKTDKALYNFTLNRINEQPTIQPAEPKKREMNIEQEKMIVEALPSLYPLQEFEEKAIDTVLDAIPHWIPVEQDLPKENYLDDGYVEPSQPVLVYMSYHTCKISRYWGNRKSKGTSDYAIPDWMDLEDYDGDNVIAWMPLPESYKGVTT